MNPISISKKQWIEKTVRLGLKTRLGLPERGAYDGVDNVQIKEGVRFPEIGGKPNPLG